MTAKETILHATNAPEFTDTRDEISISYDTIAYYMEQYANEKVKEFAKRMHIQPPNDNCQHKQTTRTHDGFIYCQDDCGSQLFPIRK